MLRRAVCAKVGVVEESSVACCRKASDGCRAGQAGTSRVQRSPQKGPSAECQSRQPLQRHCKRSKLLPTPTSPHVNTHDTTCPPLLAPPPLQHSRHCAHIQAHTAIHPSRPFPAALTRAPIACRLFCICEAHIAHRRQLRLRTRQSHPTPRLPSLKQTEEGAVFCGCFLVRSRFG